MILKMDLKETGCEHVGLIHLEQKDPMMGFCELSLSFRFHKKWGSRRLFQNAATE
jgi:hypothetical protein